MNDELSEVLDLLKQTRAMVRGYAANSAIERLDEIIQKVEALQHGNSKWTRQELLVLLGVFLELIPSIVDLVTRMIK